MAAKYKLIDCCPVPRKMYPLIMEVKRRTGETLVSCYRGDDARALLRRCGKSSQKQLWDCWVARRPGCNPANPPGRSTHELRNDGVAYSGRAGRRLRWYQVGMDWTNSKEVVRAFNKLGYAHITYPGNPREGHHINVYRKPRTRLMRFLRRVYDGRVLRRGHAGRDVSRLVRQLRFLGFLDETYKPRRRVKDNRLAFDEQIENAVREFQKKHFHKGDGIVGPQTKRQLIVSVRNKRARLKKN